MQKQQKQQMGCVESSSKVQVQMENELKRLNQQLQEKNKIIASLQNLKIKFQKDIQLKNKQILIQTFNKLVRESVPNSKHKSQKQQIPKYQPYFQQNNQRNTREQIFIYPQIDYNQQNKYEHDFEMISSQADQEKIQVVVFECPICSEQFNLNSRIPLMVCMNQHTYCQECINGMLSRNKNKCPQCRLEINSKIKNIHVCRFLEENRNLLENNNSIKRVISKPFIDIIITIDPKSPSLDKYIFKNLVIKTHGQDKKQFGLFFNEVIHQNMRNRICIQTGRSKANKIQFGLMNRYWIDHNKETSPSNGILYSLYDGKIMSCQEKQNNLTDWNVLGKPIRKDVVNRIVMEVNMDENIVRWMVNSQLFGMATISNYLKKSETVPYLAMYDAQDQVKLNPW